MRENESFEEFFNESLVDQLDSEIGYQAGSIDSHPNITILRAQGEAAAEVLLKHIIDPEIQGFWWRSRLIFTIAEDLHQPIKITDEDLNTYEVVRDTIANWGIEQGYLADS